MEETHPSLLIRLRDNRDAGAWSTFVDVYGPVVYGECRRRGLQHEDAEDVTQKVFTRALHGLRDFDYQRDKGRFRDWLGIIVRNEVFRFGRTHAKKKPLAATDSVLDGVAAPNAHDSWDASFNDHVLQIALSRCQPHFEESTWEAFTAVWLHNRPALEVATSLGLPIDKVYVAKSRVLKRLATEVETLCEDLPI